jgi:subtilisin family serine protease
MTVQVARDLPWQPERARMAVRGRVLVRMKSDEYNPHVPSHADVHLGAALAAERVGADRVDQTIRSFSPTSRVTRAFTAARNVTRPGRRHVGWDDVEESIGLSRTFRVEVDPDVSIVNLVSDLASLDRVEMVTPHYLCQAPFSRRGGAARPPASEGEDYARAMIGADEALEEEGGDSTLIVAIVDSGVALDHPEFAGRLRPGADTVDLPAEQVSRGVKLYGDFRGRDRQPMDEMGHGTACASIIGALGQGMPRGLAADARLLPVRALAGAMLSEVDEPTAVGGIPDIDLAVKTAVDLGARVLNLSFGTPESALRPDDPVPHVEVIRYALARNCVLIAASGNSGDRTNYFPAALPGVLAVGAVGPTGHPARFTTRGPAVAICAPGERIPVAGLTGYERQSGTSFAAPFVAAACALLLARAARYSSTLSASSVRSLLAATAKPFAAGADASGCGAGILHVPSALRAVDELFAQQDPDDFFEDDLMETAEDPASRTVAPQTR